MEFDQNVQDHCHFSRGNGRPRCHAPRIPPPGVVGAPGSVDVAGDITEMIVSEERYIYIYICMITYIYIYIYV